MTNEELFAKTALNSWKLVIHRFSSAIEPLTDEQLQKQVAPGKNRLLYLVGHLTAIHDRMFPLLGVGERLYPEFDKVYIDNPDRAVPDHLSPVQIKQAWTDVNTRLTAAFENLTTGQWLEKHAAVSKDDFAKEPTRNRLAILISRTSHVAFHTGQAALTKQR
jgi:hypothetical protein